MPHHRAYDEQESDYRKLRSGDSVMFRALNGHTKWVVGAASTAILTLAGWGALRISSDASEGLRSSTANGTAIEVLKEQVEQEKAFRKDVKEILQRLEAQSRDQALALGTIQSELGIVPMPRGKKK